MNNTWKSILLWGGITVVLVGAVYGLMRLGASSTPANPGTLATPVTSDDWIEGGTNAKVTLVEYSDFQCPACEQAYPMVKQLRDQFGDKLRIVYRFFPLTQIHPNAMIAAKAAEAAGKQGKFWAMHDLLFDRQFTWASSPNARTLFMQYAKDLNLDQNKFASDLDAKDVADRIDRDVQSGNNSGVNATPTFYLNGKQVILQSYEDLRNDIANAIQANP